MGHELEHSNFDQTLAQVRGDVSGELLFPWDAAVREERFEVIDYGTGSFAGGVALYCRLRVCAFEDEQEKAEFLVGEVRRRVTHGKLRLLDVAVGHTVVDPCIGHDGMLCALRSTDRFACKKIACSTRRSKKTFSRNSATLWSTLMDLSILSRAGSFSFMV